MQCCTIGQQGGWVNEGGGSGRLGRSNRVCWTAGRATGRCLFDNFGQVYGQRAGCGTGCTMYVRLWAEWENALSSLGDSPLHVC